MPDQNNGYCHGRPSELERFMPGSAPEYTRTRDSLVKKECHADARSGYNADIGDSMFQAQSPKKSRAKESSKHFGVRFRPDLQKWVAEIRVAEWKTVDKKVWLGTFDSEVGAARAVDAARKLLKCKKKRPPNFPCESLTAYSEKIPSSLNLTNLRDDSMFKEVTLFVKRTAQEYAASFCPERTSCIPRGTDQTAYCEPHQEFGLQEETLSMGSYGTSCESYNTRYGFVTGDGQWMSGSPTSVAYSSTPSCSSAGTSLEDDRRFYLYDTSYNYRHEMAQVDVEPVDGGWTPVNLPPASSHVELRGVDDEALWEGQYVLPENGQWLTEVNDFLFPYDDECFEDQNAVDTIPGDHEMMYEDSQNQSFSIVDPSLADWMSPLPQQNFNSYHSLTGSMDYNTHVC